MVSSRTSDKRSDEDLVDVCNYGDATEAAQAFSTLYDRHKDFVIRVALRFVHDNEMALDVLQDTFSYLLRKFPPTGEGLTLTAQLTSFLYPAAKNSAITLMRKAGRFPASTEQQPDELPATEASQGEDISAVLADLSAEHREVIMLRFVDELSLQEIATGLEIPLGTVKSRLHLAIKQLRQSPKTRNLLEP